MFEHGILDRTLGHDFHAGNGDVAVTVARVNGLHTTNGHAEPRKKPPVLALVCFEAPDSPVGRYAGRLALALAERQTPVHLFSRRAFEFFHPGVHVHALGECPAGSLIEQVHEFTRRAGNAFLRQFGPDATDVTLLGHEWSSVPTLSLLRGSKNVPVLLSLHSLERQRSGLSGDLARQIDAIEAAGLREARAVLTHDSVTAEVATELRPACASRLVPAPWTFPVHDFEGDLDRDAVKARYQVGPVDPLVLYVGDLDERHGADALMKAVAPVLKNYRQARFVFVGDGPLVWPLRVHARYLLLEHAVRFAGSVEGPALCELVRAADIVCVPSREPTEWWPVLAGWAARRPVLASHELAPALGLRHDEDSVLIYPHAASCVWGVEYLLSNEDHLRALADRGRRRLEERFGWDSVAAKVQELLRAGQEH